MEIVKIITAISIIILIFWILIKKCNPDISWSEAWGFIIGALICCLMPLIGEFAILVLLSVFGYLAFKIMTIK